MGRVCVCVCVCRRQRRNYQRLSFGRRHVGLCPGDDSTCAGGEPDTSPSDRRCVTQLCRGTRADCRVARVSGRACQPDRRVAPNKRRINDVMSQCIQAYCTDVMYHVRIACILHHCNRSRRSRVY